MAEKVKKTTKVSSRHDQIAKNNTKIIVTASLAAAMAVFALAGGHAILSRMSYQRRVINKQHQAVAQLKENINSLNTLVDQYGVFSKANPNLLGVSSSGTAGDQGSNARIVLDALPSQYDFPALTSSIEKILGGRGLQPSTISGTDSADSANNQPSGDPKPTPMDFTFSVLTDYQTSQNVLNDFQRSIRPFKILTLDMAGSNSSLTVNASVETYYQPSKTLNLSETLVK